MEDQVPSGARARAVAPRGKASCRLNCWLIILSSGKAELTRLVLTTAPLEADIGNHAGFFCRIFPCHALKSRAGAANSQGLFCADPFRASVGLCRSVKVEFGRPRRGLRCQECLPNARQTQYKTFLAPRDSERCGFGKLSEAAIIGANVVRLIATVVMGFALGRVGAMPSVAEGAKAESVQSPSVSAGNVTGQMVQKRHACLAQSAVLLVWSPQQKQHAARSCNIPPCARCNSCKQPGTCARERERHGLCATLPGPLASLAGSRTFRLASPALSK